MTSNPQNMMGTAFLRDKFKLPDPNKGKHMGRQIGGPSRVNPGKPIVKTSRPKRILPKRIRDDPFADGPKITEDDLSDGMMSLLTRGIIPKGVDVTPAFERGKAPFEFGAAKIYEKNDKANFKYNAPAITYKKPNSVQQKQRGPTTFITAEDGYDNNYFNEINKSSGDLFKQQMREQEEAERMAQRRSQRDVLQSNQVPEQNPQPPVETENRLQVANDQEDYKLATQESQPNIEEGLYSMYQISIKGGKAVENTPEFMSFKRINITNHLSSYKKINYK